MTEKSPKYIHKCHKTAQKIVERTNERKLEIINFTLRIKRDHQDKFFIIPFKLLSFCSVGAYKK